MEFPYGGSKEYFMKFPLTAIRKNQISCLFYPPPFFQTSSFWRCKHIPFNGLTQKRKQPYLGLSNHSHMPAFDVVNSWGGWETYDHLPFWCYPLLRAIIITVSTVDAGIHCPDSPAVQRLTAESVLRPCPWLMGASQPKVTCLPKSSPHTVTDWCRGLDNSQGPSQCPAGSSDASCGNGSQARGS